LLAWPPKNKSLENEGREERTPGGGIWIGISSVLLQLPPPRGGGGGGGGKKKKRKLAEKEKRNASTSMKNSSRCREAEGEKLERKKGKEDHALLV